MTTGADAFASYENVRGRLPGAGAGGQAHHAATLEDIAGPYELILLDAFGVLNIGESVIPDVPERLQTLRRQGKALRVLTNSASTPQSALVQKYQELGYDFTSDEVISSRQAMLAALDRGDGRTWGLMVPDGGDISDLAGLPVLRLRDDPADYRRADAFLLLGSGGWTGARQDMLEAELERAPRDVWVANPDLVAPRETGLSLEPGYYAHRLADRTGIAPRFFGKPFRNIYDLAFGQIAQLPERPRILMVGDSLHTDVLGAKEAGIASALITGYGFFAGEDPKAACDRSGIVPDFLLARP